MRYIEILTGIFLILFSSGIAAPSKKDSSLPDFHLDAPQLLKVSQRSSELHVGDVNGDGLADILTVANEKSILELELQQPGKQPTFKRQEVVLDQFVQGLAILDVDGDGRMDIVVAGSPARLSWLRQGEDGVLSSPQSLAREAEDLAAADLNGDGVDDLVCTNQQRIEIILSAKHGLDWSAAAVYWSPHNIQGAPKAIDLDGDGLPDLVFGESQRNDRLLVRFQTPEGFFPDESIVTTNGIKDLDVLSRGAARPTLLGILNKTDSLEQWVWKAENSAQPASTPSDQAFGRIRTLAFDPDSRSDRLVAGLAPLADGGIPCILVASPAAPSIRLIRATRDGSLSVRSVPALTGIAQVLPIPPSKKDAPWTVALVSRTEKSLAIARISKEGDSMTFPQPILLGGAPQAAAVDDLGKGNALDLAVCRSSENDSLVMEIHYDLDPLTAAESETTTFSLKGQVGDRPSSLLAADINGDQKTDLMVLFDYADPLILLQKEEGRWEPLRVAEGMLQGLLTGVRAGNVLVAPLGPKGENVLLITKENYARAIHLGPDNQLVIDGQFNGRNTHSRLRVAVVADVAGPKDPHVVLLDLANHCLTLYHRPPKATEFELLRNIDIEDADYQTILAADVNEDKREDILLAAPDRLTVLYPGIPAGYLETVAKAKTDVQDGQYGSVAAIDLLGKGDQQIVAVEQTENVLECFLNQVKDGSLERFYRFKVFDSDAIRSRRESAMGQVEPREMIASDLNGDGKPDLVLLMHEVIGIYYQR